MVNQTKPQRKYTSDQSNTLYKILESPTLEIHWKMSFDIYWDTVRQVPFNASLLDQDNDHVVNPQNFCPFFVSQHYSCPRKPWKYLIVFCCCEIRVFTCGMLLWWRWESSWTSGSLHWVEVLLVQCPHSPPLCRPSTRETPLQDLTSTVSMVPQFYQPHSQRSPWPPCYCKYPGQCSECSCSVSWSWLQFLTSPFSPNSVFQDSGKLRNDALSLFLQGFSAPCHFHWWIIHCLWYVKITLKYRRNLCPRAVHQNHLHADPQDSSATSPDRCMLHMDIVVSHLLAYYWEVVEAQKSQLLLWSLQSELRS